MLGTSELAEEIPSALKPHGLGNILIGSDRGGPDAFITGALLKVASRCNLNCDYCYVYKHADQGWRDQPRFMSDVTVSRFAERLKEYVAARGLKEFSITFHGGEPLLYGADRLAKAADTMRRIVGENCALDFSLQSNGTLLTDEAITILEAAQIGVSLSLDGPEEVNNRHRRDHSHRSSFVGVVDAIERLKTRRSPIFRGVIAVIDADVYPEVLFEFFTQLQVPQLDLLLPDSTHARQPPGRAECPELYTKWLRQALTLWYTKFSELPIRWFDTLLASRLGVPSPTDAMGLGAVSLLVVDTDGSYTDHDVFKITAPGGGIMGRGVNDASFEEISQHPVLREHGFRLTIEGLSPECRGCPVVEACGGGSVMHRWHPNRGLDAPSVYCAELFAILETATQLVNTGISLQNPAVPMREVPIVAGESFVVECQHWRAETESRASKQASELGINRSTESAAALLLARPQEKTMQSGAFPHRSAPLHWLDGIVLQSDDPRLMAPFLDSIRLLPQTSEEVRYGIAALEKVQALHSVLDPYLPAAFSALISDILFVESTVDSNDHIFSFSDDSAPNVLYIAPFCNGAPLGHDDLGDSLLHEFLHHVLYQMERDGPMLLDHIYPRFPAPWRAGLRQAGGFFHGTFVFAGLSQYWAALARSEGLGIHTAKASANAASFSEQAIFGIQSLRQFALLTARGEALLSQLADKLGVNAHKRMDAPGQALVG